MRDPAMHLVSVQYHSRVGVYVKPYPCICSVNSKLCFFPDVFENLSLSVKKERYDAPQDTLQDQEELTGQVEVAEKQMNLYEVHVV